MLDYKTTNAKLLPKEVRTNWKTHKSENFTAPEYVLQVKVHFFEKIQMNHFFCTACQDFFLRGGGSNSLFCLTIDGRSVMPHFHGCKISG